MPVAMRSQSTKQPLTLREGQAFCFDSGLPLQPLMLCVR